MPPVCTADRNNRTYSRVTRANKKPRAADGKKRKRRENTNGEGNGREKRRGKGKERARAN